MSTLDELVDRLSGLAVAPSVLRQEGRLLRAAGININSQASRVELGKYVGAVSKEVVAADRAFLRGQEFRRASNKAKADAIRNIMEPGVIDAYDLVNGTTRRFYNTMFESSGLTQRASSLPMDTDRLNSATANIIERTLTTPDREHPLLLEAERLVRDAYDNNIKNGNRDVVIGTAGNLGNALPITAVRQVRSDNPCEYCQRHDGSPVRTTGTGVWRETQRRGPTGHVGTGEYRQERRDVAIDEPVIRFHDNCSCEIVLFYG